MAYAFQGEGALDYFPCHYGTSKLVFRGPKRSLERPYIAFLGGTETYGKFVPDPFPDLVEEEIGFGSVNLGSVNAGIDLYLNEPGLIDLARGAEAVVVQVLGAGNLSNHFYTVHPRRNDRFLGATPALKTLYREVDFTAFNFTRHMLLTLHATSKERFEIVAEDLRATWLRRMKDLLRQLPARTVLLWLADHQPPAATQRLGLSLDPILVDEQMIAELKPLAGSFVEAISSVEARLAGLDGMAFPALEAPAAAAMAGPEVHREVAQILTTELERVLI